MRARPSIRGSGQPSFRAGTAGRTVSWAVKGAGTHDAYEMTAAWRYDPPSMTPTTHAPRTTTVAGPAWPSAGARMTNAWTQANASRRPSRLWRMRPTTPAPLPVGSPSSRGAARPAQNVIHARARKFVPVATNERVDGRLACRADEGARSDAKKGRDERMRFHGRRTAAPRTKTGGRRRGGFQVSLGRAGEERRGGGDVQGRVGNGGDEGSLPGAMGRRASDDDEGKAS